VKRRDFASWRRMRIKGESSFSNWSRLKIWYLYTAPNSFSSKEKLYLLSLGIKSNLLTTQVSIICSIINCFMTEAGTFFLSPSNSKSISLREVFLAQID